MKNDPKSSHRWQNPQHEASPSIADEVLAKGKDADGLLAKIAHEVKREQFERATRPTTWVPVQKPASQEKPKGWLPESEFRAKMRFQTAKRDRGRKPWQRRRA